MSQGIKGILEIIGVWLSIPLQPSELVVQVLSFQSIVNNNFIFTSPVENSFLFESEVNNNFIFTSPVENSFLFESEVNNNFIFGSQVD